MCNMGTSCTQGEELLRQLAFHHEYTMKQMFDIFAKLVSEQDEIYGLKTIDWEDSSWKYLSLIGDEQVIRLLHAKVYVFSDCIWCLGKIHENPNQTLHGNKIGLVQNISGIQKLGQN